MKSAEKKKIRVAVLCGGKSAEHEVSLQSARNIVRAMAGARYELTLVGIDKGGRWSLHEVDDLLAAPGGDGWLTSLGRPGRPVALAAGAGPRCLIDLNAGKPVAELDVVFPVLHGPHGEDGTVQGLLKLAGIAFVGSSILGSAVGMDKEAMKKLLKAAGLPVAAFEVLHRRQAGKADFAAISGRLGLPLFVKPANMGSSVGVARVENRAEFAAALRTALQYDDKVLVESFVQGREIECSVLGDEEPIASLPGEIVPRAEFYSYRAKYLDENGAELKAPADLPDSVVKQVQALAIESFQACFCEGMARVDLFLTADNRAVVNEINTIPGFTSISMYPRLWEVSGLPPSKLIDRLIELALARHRREARLTVSCEDKPVKKGSRRRIGG